MHRDRDLDPPGGPPGGEEALAQDLDLAMLWDAMAGGDPSLREAARTVTLACLTDPREIVYRQAVLADCVAHPALVREIHELAVDALQAERRILLGSYMLRDSPVTMLSRALRVLEMFVGVLRALRAMADEHATAFRSEGFVRFFAMLQAELDDDYLATIDGHVRELGFPRGLLMGAGLGPGNRGVGHVLRRPPPEPRWTQRILRRGGTALSFAVAPRDDAGMRALGRLRGRGVGLAADSVARSTDHIGGFFRSLRAELAFYIGCLNLQARLAEVGRPTCVPVPVAAGRPALCARGLCDVSLALRLGGGAVGTDVDADGRRLLMVTGANRGGKSTFLRSLGLAQLMMQCGMFVAAEAFRADVRAGVFTHFAREEDAGMTSGRLDDELGRMSGIADRITPNGLLLCNESFAATNEREGSEIARQVIRALTEAGVKVVFVTHLFDLAHGLRGEGDDEALFLRAERRPDGGRTFRMVEGAPLPTSYGPDIYRRVFGGPPAAAPAALTGAGRGS